MPASLSTQSPRARFEYSIAVGNLLFERGAARRHPNGMGLMTDAEMDAVQEACDRNEPVEVCVDEILAARAESDRLLDVLAEARAAEQRVVGEQPYGDFLARMRQAAECATCHKTQAVQNIAVRGWKAERITRETHCHCPGSPVLAVLKGLPPLEVLR